MPFSPATSSAGSASRANTPVTSMGSPRISNSTGRTPELCSDRGSDDEFWSNEIAGNQEMWPTPPDMWLNCFVADVAKGRRPLPPRSSDMARPSPWIQLQRAVARNQQITWPLQPQNSAAAQLWSDDGVQPPTPQAYRIFLRDLLRLPSTAQDISLVFGCDADQDIVSGNLDCALTRLQERNSPIALRLQMDSNLFDSFSALNLSFDPFASEPVQAGKRQDPTVLRLFATTLPQWQQLTGLSLIGFGDRPEQLRALLQHLPAYAPLQQLRFSAAQLSSPAQLPSPLWRNLSAQTQLTQLALSDLTLDPAAWHNIAQSVRAMPHLLSFALENARTIGRSDLMQVMRATASLPDLFHIRLSRVGLAGNHLSAILPVLAQCNSLGHLDLSSNGLSDSDFEALLTSPLLFRKSALFLDLFQNLFDRFAAASLVHQRLNITKIPYLEALRWFEHHAPDCNAANATAPTSAPNTPTAGLSLPRVSRYVRLHHDASDTNDTWGHLTYATVWHSPRNDSLYLF